jgi:hypothetical protein
VSVLARSASGFLLTRYIFELNFSGAAPAAGDAPAKKEEKPKVEEVDALEGGMDMFGGGGAKTGDY